MKWKQLRGLALMAAGLWTVPSVHADTDHSTWIIPGPSGRLLWQPDEQGNRILGFSGVGYPGGTVPISEVLVKVTR